MNIQALRQIFISRNGVTPPEYLNFWRNFC